MDALNKLNEHYLEDFAVLLPIHRVIQLLICIPPIVGIAQGQSDGVLASYLSSSPMEVFQTGTGLMWKLSWAAWVLLFATFWGSAYVATFARRTVVFLISRSKYKPKYLDHMAAAANKIRTNLSNTENLADALKDRHLLRKRMLDFQVRAAETFIASACLIAIYCTIWHFEDAIVFVVLLIVGALIEINSHRYFIAAVAPPYLLYGYLTDRFHELEDSYYP